MNKANNPFGATRPNEVLCIESKALPTRLDGTVWIYVAMDAHSRYAFHHDIKRQSVLPEYFIFITEVLKKHPELKNATLAVDTPAEMGTGLRKFFPHFADVVCDESAVSKVTEEFHVAFLGHMGQQGRSN